MNNKKEKKEIPTMLLKLIEVFSQKEMTGKDKKKAVVDEMVKTFDLDLDMVLMISEMIDIIILISKNKDKIKRKSKKCINLCF